MSIRSKIFMLVVFGIIGVAGISGFTKYSGIKKNAYMAVLGQSQTGETVMLQIMMAEEKFINTLDSRELSGLGGYKLRLEETLTRIKSYNAGAGISDSAAQMSQTEAEHGRIFQSVAQALDEMSKTKADLFAKTESVNTHVKESIGVIDKEEAMLFPQGETLSADKTELRKELSDLLVLLSDRIMNIQDLLLYGNASKYQETRQAIEKKLELRKKNISVSVPTMKDFIQSWEATMPILAEIAADDSAIFDLWGKNNDLRKTLQHTAAQIQEKSESISEASKAILESSSKSTDRIRLIVSLGVILILSGLGILIAKSINKSLRNSIAGLLEGADQVAAASGQVSNASQQLADGASQQAASLEETSASLEQVSAMTKQNADNSTQANKLMAEAKQVVERANESMLRVTESMGQITKANLQTQKIIKTIDEIAFQTNLLALNAAVEAARAGESGAGFAVVADEVRNLAMRSAEAAKNTANLIEETVKTVKEGFVLVETTSSQFNSVASTVSKSGELIGEIAAASNEQAHGIAQVSRAVSDLDKVVQSNAASAEQSAAASEQMNAQAEQMKVYVGDLKSLVDGSKNNADITVTKTASVKPQTAKSNKIQPAVFAARVKAKEIAHVQTGNGKDHHYIKKVENNPEEVIPFDEGDFSDF